MIKLGIHYQANQLIPIQLDADCLTYIAR